MPRNYVELFPIKEKPTKIDVPEIISEKSQINGFVFSKEFLKEAKINSIKITKAMIAGVEDFKYKNIAKKMALTRNGGPTIGENSITLWIDNSITAGSNTHFIWLIFGRSGKRIKLLGHPTAHFPKGTTMTWNLNQVSDFLTTIPTDAWDNLILKNENNDGILLNRIRIIHSDIDIVDWSKELWLDNSISTAHGKIGLVAKIKEKKLSYISNSWVPQLHHAALELGKTKGRKYFGTTDEWCSEFASWCLRKILWNTPTGSIGSDDMEGYFRRIGRGYTKAQLLNGTYKPIPGDYLRFCFLHDYVDEDGNEQVEKIFHSGLYLEDIDSWEKPTSETRFMTIEGNAGHAVRVCGQSPRLRKIDHLVSVGCTK